MDNIDRLTQVRLNEILQNPDQRQRYETAMHYLQDYAKARPEDVQNFINGTDFQKDVEVVILQPGDVLKRYELPNQKGDGNFYTSPNTPIDEIALQDCAVDVESNRNLEIFTANREISVLKSIARNVGEPTENSFNPSGLLYSGGGEQFFVAYPDRISGAFTKLASTPLQTDSLVATDSQTQKDSASRCSTPTIDDVIRADSERRLAESNIQISNEVKLRM